MSQVNPIPPSDPKDPQVRREMLEAAILNKDKKRLHSWIKIHLGLDIPQKAICNDHDAPFDFVADYIFGDLNFAIVVANRSGGKTMNFGALDTIMSYISPHTEVATVGAIQSQAQKCYQYFKDFSAKPIFSSHIVSMTMNKTDLDNNSTVQVLTGTMSGVNSPHPQLVFIDEIDLMLWNILQQAFSMAQSNEHTRARTIVTSTRKFANGPMQRMIIEAGKKKQKVYMWCIWEVVASLPVGNKLLMDKIKETFGNELPDRINEANGYYYWEDLLVKRDTLDDDTWATEWLCSRPGLTGIVYGSYYQDENHLINDPEWTPVGRDGHIYLAEDFGFAEGHPDVVLFCWIPPSFDRIIVFDELYMYGYNTDQIWTAIDDKLQEYGHNLPNRYKKVKGTIRGWVPDYHGLTEIDDRKSRGAPMMDKVEDSELYKIINGIGLVRKLFSAGRLMYHARCVNLRLETLSYRFKKNLDGTYSEITVKTDDHGPDCLRYLVIRLYSLIMRKVSATMDREAEMNNPQEARVRAVIKRERTPLSVDKDKPITSGLMESNSWR
jgi:hypothetical protein